MKTTACILLLITLAAAVSRAGSNPHKHTIQMAHTEKASADSVTSTWTASDDAKGGALHYTNLPPGYVLEWHYKDKFALRAKNTPVADWSNSAQWMPKPPPPPFAPDDFVVWATQTSTDWVLSLAVPANNKLGIAYYHIFVVHDLVGAALWESASRAQGVFGVPQDTNETVEATLVWDSSLGNGSAPKSH